MTTLPVISVKLAGHFGVLDIPKVVRAYQTPVPGLAVHHAVNDDGIELPGWWRVTHIDSGCGLHAWFKTRNHALRWANALRQKADWTKNAEALRKTPGLEKFVRSRAKRFGRPR